MLKRFSWQIPPHSWFQTVTAEIQLFNAAATLHNFHKCHAIIWQLEVPQATSHGSQFLCSQNNIQNPKSIKWRLSLAVHIINLRIGCIVMCRTSGQYSTGQNNIKKKKLQPRSSYYSIKYCTPNMHLIAYLPFLHR